MTNGDLIDSARVDHAQQWWHSGLVGNQFEYPIDSDDQMDVLIEQFVAMYPIYQATCERLAGVEDRFTEYYQLLQGARLARTTPRAKTRPTIQAASSILIPATASTPSRQPLRGKLFEP